MINFFIVSLDGNMEVPDVVFGRNRDWDPTYLRDLMMDDFFDFSDLWSNENVGDTELVRAVNRCEHEYYCPVVEDISIEDEVLCNAVQKVEQE